MVDWRFLEVNNSKNGILNILDFQEEKTIIQSWQTSWIQSQDFSENYSTWNKQINNDQ